MNGQWGRILHTVDCQFPHGRFKGIDGIEKSLCNLKLFIIEFLKLGKYLHLLWLLISNAMQ